MTYASPKKPAREKKAHLFERDGLDWYREPISCTAAFLVAERFLGRVRDPACGGGNIVAACLDAGLHADGSDIRRRVPQCTSWYIGDEDFLTSTARVDNIICNPPFFKAKGTEAFIRKALELAVHKVAIFTSVPFLSGAGRANGLFAEHPPVRVWMVTPRPSCPPGEYLADGGKAGSGTEDYVWLVWDRSTPFNAETRLGWLRSPKASLFAPAGASVAPAWKDAPAPLYTGPEDAAISVPPAIAPVAA